MKQWSLGLALGIWLLLTSAGIFVFGAQSLKEFDPKLHLSSQLMNLDFEYKLLDSIPEGNASRIYHILDSGCGCTLVNNMHRNALNQWAKTNNIEQMTLKLDSYPELARFVPSTPAVLVVDSQSNLVYFGPYAQGSACFGKEGFVDSAIKPYFQNELAGNAFNPIIRSEAIGCYCQNARATGNL